jgi:hypothetical protein
LGLASQFLSLSEKRLGVFTKALFFNPSAAVFQRAAVRLLFIILLQVSA